MRIHASTPGKRLLIHGPMSIYETKKSRWSLDLLIGRPVEHPPASDCGTISQNRRVLLCSWVSWQRQVVSRLSFLLVSLNSFGHGTLEEGCRSTSKGRIRLITANSCLCKVLTAMYLFVFHFIRSITSYHLDHIPVCTAFRTLRRTREQSTY